MTTKLLVAVPLVALLGVTACTETTTFDPRSRATAGALAGAAIGGLAGASADKNSTEKAIVGAAIGAAIGGGIGAQLDRQAADLRARMGNDNVTIVNTGSRLVVTMPQDILFATDSAVVVPSLQQDLRALAYNLRDYPNTTVQVIGHTDNTGAAEYNQQLSQRRASSVTAILTANGVAPGRVVAYGRGEDQPIASNLTPEGRAQNRRVEVIITPNS